MKFSDKEVLSVMRDAVDRGFDAMADAWTSGKYGSDDATNYANYRKFKLMKERALEMIRSLKEAVKQ